MAALRAAGKFLAGAGTGAASAVVMAGLSMPGSGFLVFFLAIVLLGVACWVIRSDARADRVSRILLAWRGNAGCLGRGAAAPGPPALRSRHRPWQRRLRTGRQQG